MVDLIPGVSFSDTEKQVYGSIFGAMLGALMGAAATFYISYHTRKKEIELQKIRENKTVIRADGLANKLANVFLMNLIVKNAANRQFASDVGKGILDEEGKNTVFQINIPYTYPQAPEITNDFVNENILAHWNSLNQEIDLQNKGIEGFSTYYNLLRTTIHSQVFTGNQESLNRRAIDSDNTMIVEAMKTQAKADTSFRQRCIKFVALLRCYNKYYLSFDLKDSTSLANYREAINKMSEYEPSEEELATAIEEVNKIYDEAGLFKSEAFAGRDLPPT